MSISAMTTNLTAKRMIWVTWQRAGFHCYPKAPQQVDYLAQRHRHLFKFRVWIEVEHNERDIEFHMFLGWLQSLYESRDLELDNRSCESISDDLHDMIAGRYPDREIWIEVSEDGECGCFMRYEASEPRK